MLNPPIQSPTFMNGSKHKTIIIFFFTILFSISLTAQVPQNPYNTSIKKLRGKGIDTIIDLSNFRCQTSVDSSFNENNAFSQEVSYLLWLDKGQLYLQKFIDHTTYLDSASHSHTYKPAILEVPFITMFSRTDLAVIRSEKLRPFTYSFKKDEGIIVKDTLGTSHPCVAYLTIHVKNVSTEKQINRFDLDSVYQYTSPYDNKVYTNINESYNYNNSLTIVKILYFIEHIAEKQTEGKKFILER